MQTINIEILNPHVLKILQNLQEMKLIKVNDEPSSKLKAYLKKMRKNEKSVPSLEEITELVEQVREERYAK